MTRKMQEVKLTKKDRKAMKNAESLVCPKDSPFHHFYNDDGTCNECGRAAPMCADCKKHVGTVQYSDWFTGPIKMRCKCCVAQSMLEQARREAAKIPELVRELGSESLSCGLRTDIRKAVKGVKRR